MPSHSKSRQPISRGRCGEGKEDKSARRTAGETEKEEGRKVGEERDRGAPRGKSSHEEGNVQMPSRTLSHCNFVLAAESPEEKDLERTKYCNCVIMKEGERERTSRICVSDGKKSRVYFSQVCRASPLRCLIREMIRGTPLAKLTLPFL